MFQETGIESPRPFLLHPTRTQGLMQALWASLAGKSSQAVLAAGPHRWSFSDPGPEERDSVCTRVLLSELTHWACETDGADKVHLPTLRSCLHGKETEHITSPGPQQLPRAALSSLWGTVASRWIAIVVVPRKYLPHNNFQETLPITAFYRNMRNNYITAACNYYIRWYDLFKTKK